MSIPLLQQEMAWGAPPPSPTNPPRSPIAVPIPETPLDGEVSMQETSFALETNPDSDEVIDWIINSPLVNTLDEIQVVPGRSVRWFEAAKRRKEVKSDEKLSLRRDTLLCIAENFLDRSNVPASRVMSHAADGFFKDELTLLDSVLLGHPGRIPGSSVIGYYLEKMKYERLQEHLTRLAVDRQGTLQSLNLPPPPIPTLPSAWPIDSLWRARDLEIFCVTLHEDVENYLAFYWDAIAKTKGAWKIPRDDAPSPSFPDVKEVTFNLVLFQMRYIAAQHVMQRNIAADAHFNEAKVREIQENLAPEHDYPPHISMKGTQQSILPYPARESFSSKRDIESNLPIDYEQSRRKQSTVYNHEPRPSFTTNSPYNQDPTKLTGLPA